ncbi:MAG: glycosyltransferase [Spirochaetota bacterium]
MDRETEGRQPRVLVLLTASYGGGAERLVLDQLKHSADPGQYAVATLRAGNIEGEFRAAARRHEVPYFSLCAARGRPLGAAFRLARYIGEAGIEVVHAHLPEAMIVAAAVKVLRPRVRVIITKHNAEPYMKRPLWRAVNYVSGMLAARIVCVSEGVRRFDERYAYPRKLEVVYNGIDTRRFSPGPTGVREELGIGAEHNLIGVVGRLARQKGHRYLLEALRRILDRGVEATLLIVGHGEEEDRIRGAIAELGLEPHVRMVSYRDDIEALYNSLDLFCLPSLWEGFGLVLAEAMACGVPVVATRITGVTEVVAENEGFLVEPGDSDALAGAIERALTDDAERAARARRGFEKAQRFDIRRSVAELEALYQRVAETSSPSRSGSR